MSKALQSILFAPPEFWALTPGQRADICNGCGTKGLVGFLVPDTLWGLRITAACDIHDFMYAIGATIRDKETADRVFLNNMLRIINEHTHYDWLKRLRAGRAQNYYRAVVHFGGPAFWAGKNKPEEEGPAWIEKPLLQGI
jgi:hypothetical protein